MKAAWLPLIALLAMAGCQTSPGERLIRGFGNAPIEQVNPASFPEEGGLALPWAKNELRTSNRIELEDSQHSQGAQVGFAKLTSLDLARKDLRTKVLALEAGPPGTIGDFIADHPELARAVDAAINSAESELSIDRETREVSVEMTLPLSTLAEIAIREGAGYVAGTDDGVVTYQQAMDRSITNAQRLALTQARQDLLEKLGNQTLDDQLISERMRQSPAFAGLVTRALRGARIASSKQLGEKWHYELVIDMSALEAEYANKLKPVTSE